MENVPAWADRYIGQPYAPRGRGPDGTDCWGLVRLVLGAEYGLELPSYVGDYAHPTDAAAIAPLIDRERQGWALVRITDARAGDVVVLRIVGQPLHVGVVVAPGIMLHQLKGTDAHLERYTDRRWAQRIEGIYRHDRLA